MLTAEREHVESQMKSENLLGSKESLHKSASDLSGKGNKPPPSRVVTIFFFYFIIFFYLS